METAHCSAHAAFNIFCPSCIEAKRDQDNAKPEDKPADKPRGKPEPPKDEPKNDQNNNGN